MNPGPEPPPKLPGYDYVSLIGNGGFSTVFRYHQLDLDRPVAIKVMRGNLGPNALDQFRTEANLMAKLSKHSAVVPVFSTGVAPDGRAYLVMEMCGPRSLAVEIARRPLQVPRALEIAIQIAGAVETAHGLGVLHRDIKPANILFISRGRPALTDFGIAARAGAASTDAFSIAWAPPEQIRGQVTGPAADVYSLAATTYAMLAGHSPFEGAGLPADAWNLTQRVYAMPPPRTGRGDVPESLERILQVALAKDPAQRYPSATEFARALQSVQSELGAPVTTIDVLTEDEDDWDDSGGDTGTRVTGFPTFDPDQPPPFAQVPTGTGAFGRGTPRPSDTVTSGPPAPLPPPSPGWMGAGYDRPEVVQHGFGSQPAQPPRRWAGHDTPDAREIPATAAVAPAKRRRGVRTVAAVVAVVVLVALVAVGGTWLSGNLRATSDDRATPTARPVDPIGQVVPAPTDARAVRAGDQVVVTWTNPDPKPGDHYLYRVPEIGVNKAYQRTDQTMARVPAAPGKVCVEILVRRSNGRSSEPVVVCTEE